MRVCDWLKFAVTSNSPITRHKMASPHDQDEARSSGQGLTALLYCTLYTQQLSADLMVKEALARTLFLMYGHAGQLHMPVS